MTELWLVTITALANLATVAIVLAVARAETRESRALMRYHSDLAWRARRRYEETP